MNNDDMPFNLRLKDVYDFAVEIATDFEKLVDICGVDETTFLVNRVITVLEYLEASVKKIEHSEKEIANLKLNYDQLSSEKLTYDEDKVKLEQDFEEMEETWERETVQLRSIIIKLQGENRLLQSNLDDKKVSTQQTGDCDADIIHDQRNFISKLNNTLRNRDCQLKKFISDIETLNSKIDHLHGVNKSLHLNHQQVRNEMQKLNEENSELKTKLCQQEQAVVLLEQNLAEAYKHKLDIEDDYIQSSKNDFKMKDSVTEDRINMLLQEKHNLRGELNRVEHDLIASKTQVAFYKEKAMHSTKHQNQWSFQRSNGIRQLFHLFLGVVSFKPQLHNM